MVAYRVLRTETTSNFTECVFLDTLDGVYVEIPGDGFHKHPIFNGKSLQDHLKRLKSEGFLVKRTTLTVRV